jgi:prolipoprotein diacylglyceryltransferase
MGDLTLILFVCGIVGARITYMLQYHVPFDRFFHIWEGGIVFYGSAIGGFVGYWIVYFVFFKKFNIKSWQLGDLIAPAIALGVGIGRVGCLLNGCCYGQVAPDQCPKIAFPLMTAPVREVVVDQCQYQTVTGFLVKPSGFDDIRSVVTRVEHGSNAERAGLEPGDKILKVNDRVNAPVLWLSLPDERAKEVGDWFVTRKAIVDFFEGLLKNERRLRISFPEAMNPSDLLLESQRTLRIAIQLPRLDVFRETILNWPKGRHDLSLEIERKGQLLNIQFTPRSLGLHPTQIYESISMGLLTLLLLAFYPFRRHDGQVFVLLIVCYAVHRFLNEILRDDTTPVAFNMTLSQNISLLMLLAGLALELFLRATQGRLPTTPATPVT